MIKSCHLCGKWDGTNLWVQWDAEGAAVLAQVSIRKQGGEWSPWTAVGLTSSTSFAVIPIWKSGWDARIRMKLMMAEDWGEATEVTFERSEALFQISTEVAPLSYRVHPLSGTAKIFTQIVDSGACSFALEEDLDLQPGERKQVKLRAMQSSGWHQLDRENDFILQPSAGVVVRNVEPSVNDVKVTGRNFTTLEQAKIDGPFIMGFGKSNL